MTNPYTVLGIQHGASADIAKAAFKNLAKTCHPDLFPNDPAKEAQFKEISAAYDEILHPERAQAAQFTHAPAGFHFSTANVFDELFANIHRVRNNNLQATCHLTLEEAFTGKTVDVQTLGGNRSLQVIIPGGVSHGMQLVVQQAGENHISNQRPGDLYIQILILPHNRFVRDGANLHTSVTMSAIDVLNQVSVEIKGIDGQRLRATIPAGFDTSRRIRLSGHGMPDRDGRGDLFLELHVTFPVLSADQRRLAEQLSV